MKQVTSEMVMRSAHGKFSRQQKTVACAVLGAGPLRGPQGNPLRRAEASTLVAQKRRATIGNPVSKTKAISRRVARRIRGRQSC